MYILLSRGILMLTLCMSVMYSGVYAQSCSCSSGILGKDISGITKCVESDTLPAVDNGPGPLVVLGSQNQNYGGYGSIIYPYNATYTTQTINTSTFFASLYDNAFRYGRQINLSVKSDGEILNEYQGFSICVNAPEDGEYMVTGAGDDLFELYIDGNLVVSHAEYVSSGGTDFPFAAFRRYYTRPVYFSAGPHIIELKYLNQGGPGYIGGELVGPFAPGSLLDPLTGIGRDPSVIDAFLYASGTISYTMERSGEVVDAPAKWVDNMIWTTMDELGDTIHIGESVGVSCPTGYAANANVNTCGGIECVRIQYTEPACSVGPDAEDDVYTGSIDTPLMLTVTDNDTDSLGSGLILTGVTIPSSGSVTVSGTVIDYIPMIGFCGVDTFDYTIEDGNGSTDAATVTVTIPCPVERIRNGGPSVSVPKIIEKEEIVEEEDNHFVAEEKEAIDVDEIDEEEVEVIEEKIIQRNLLETINQRKNVGNHSFVLPENLQETGASKESMVVHNTYILKVLSSLLSFMLLILGGSLLIGKE